MKPTKTQKKKIYQLLREIVVKRDGEKCLRCKKQQQLQLSHIYPKGRYRRMEFEPENLKFLCYACHFHFWHKSPIEAWEWLRLIADELRLQRLKLMSLSTDKWNFDPKLHMLFLEKELTKYDS